MLEMINEELNIKACHLADLTMDQVNSFLKQWEEGAKIGTLILFYEKDSGTLVLNKDNKLYEEYRIIAEEYMGAPPSKRRDLGAECPECNKEMIKVMESCLKYRVVSKELYRARKNAIPQGSSTIVLNEIWDKYDPASAVVTAFRYGVMQGKRAERIRRKFHTQNGTKNV